MFDDPNMPSVEQLDSVCAVKYGRPEKGWGPRLRRRWGYYPPDDVYEATVARAVTPGLSWLDVGCGRHIFPANPLLAAELAGRCSRLVGVDPDATILENQLLQHRVQSSLDDYVTDETFDLVTLRMVVEHVQQPQAFMASLARLVREKGLVVVYTVDRWSPTAMAAAVVPHSLHHPVKAKLWATEERDTFPVAYRMNDRRTLQRLFAGAGFDTVSFAYLPDCSVTSRYPRLHATELALWHTMKTMRLGYFERCLLGVYQKAGLDHVASH